MRNTWYVFKRTIRKFVSYFYKLDDFDWNEYHKECQDITELASKFTVVLSKDMYQIIKGKIFLNSGLLPLSPGIKLLYETVYHLNPKSILEVGFGRAEHIVNLNLLLPEAKFYGIDISPKQLDLALYMYPQLKNIAELTVIDVTKKDALNTLEKVDLVYTQAVLMHIKRGDRHIDALRNMFNISLNYILLKENWTSHNFFDDIINLSKECDFPWPELNMYKDDSGESIVVILSRKELKEFSPLRNNEELLKYNQRRRILF